MIHRQQYRLQQPKIFYPQLVDVTGSVNAALLLGQCIYWSERLPAEREGWFYKTRNEWYAETRLSRSEQETARRKCKMVGVLQEQRRGVPAKLWYRVDFQRLDELLERCENLAVGHFPANWSAGIPPTSRSESCQLIHETTSTTTASKHDRQKPVDGFGALRLLIAFEAFWKSYPRKVGKRKARELWWRLQPDTRLGLHILAAVEDWKLSADWNKKDADGHKGAFIPHPTTWLNRGGWDDEVPTYSRVVKMQERNQAAKAHTEARRAAEAKTLAESETEPTYKGVPVHVLQRSADTDSKFFREVWQQAIAEGIIKKGATG